jgi:catechol 2,3-dioxygenase-like lactoylglutathione lyase family enzyme
MSTQKQSEATPLDLKFEAVVLPVSDVDRAKRFYEGLGWRMDGDFPISEDYRVVNFTPPGSAGSILFGKGVTTAAPGSVQGLVLAVSDIQAARADLKGRGVDVSEVFHGGPRTGAKGREPGPDPQGRSYFTLASFRDPDGNVWLLQEIKERLPGRGGLITSAATLTELLRETETRHGEYERTAPKHHWSGWYAGYILARENGKTPDEAAKLAALQVERARKEAA